MKDELRDYIALIQAFSVNVTSIRSNARIKRTGQDATVESDRTKYSLTIEGNRIYLYVKAHRPYF